MAVESPSPSPPSARGGRRAATSVVLAVAGLALAVMVLVAFGRRGVIHIVPVRDVDMRSGVGALLAGRNNPAPTAIVTVESSVLGLRPRRSEQTLYRHYDDVRAVPDGLLLRSGVANGDMAGILDPDVDDDTALAVGAWMRGDHSTGVDIPFGRPIRGYGGSAAIALVTVVGSLSLARRRGAAAERATQGPRPTVT